MKKKIVAAGIILLFLGLVLLSLSGVAINQTAQTWTNVKEIKPEKPTRILSVEGNLTQGDKYRVYFLLSPMPDSFPIDAGVVVNVTDQQENLLTYHDIDIVREGQHLVPQQPLPRGIANYTGTYKVHAEGVFGVLLSRLSLQRLASQIETQYPYSAYTPVGIIVLSGGIGASLVGIRSTKRRKRKIKSNPARTYNPHSG